MEDQHDAGVRRVPRGELLQRLERPDLHLAWDAERRLLPASVEAYTAAPGRLRPDFSFVTADGDLILWEHLGMLSRPDYKRGWEWKRAWYQKNGFAESKTLFTSTEEDGKGLDSTELKRTALAIKALLE